MPASKKKLPPRAANFQVDTRLAVLLGESYASTERALKELVDNAWDADADHVWVTLPAPMSSESIIIRDDGAGMTEREVRQEYLFIANDRSSRKGTQTPHKKRQVKGRKGVGKFAGLSAAATMRLSTQARGVRTSITVDRKALAEAGRDIESVPLPVQIDICEVDDHGTTIVLTELDQNLHFPSPDKFRQVLIRDYGREDGFSIFVNDKPLGFEDLGGSITDQAESVNGVGAARLRFAVTEDKARIRGAGIVIRVNGKAIGRPTFFGLDEAEDFPRSLLGKVYGEIEADGLAGDLSGDGAFVVENSIAFEKLKEWAVPHIREQVSAVYSREMQLAQARLKQKINRRLATLPEHKREFAEVALNKLLKKYYGDTEDRLETVVNVVLDALDRDEYFAVLERIDEAQHADVMQLAEALDEFGLVDLAQIAQQAQQRLRFLDYIDRLAASEDTDELVMHKAIEQNLWLLGNEYGLLASNKSLKNIVSEVLDKIYTGKRASERPDLLLASNVLQQQVLIEFKKPLMRLKFDHYQQATKYRHELSRYLPASTEVYVIGGFLETAALPKSPEANVKASTYKAIIANARRQVEWLLNQLASSG
jgi:hypothetical protein